MTVDTQPTVADLGRLVKAKYPVYGSVPDDELGRRVRAKYPAYQRFVDVPAPGASAQIAEIRARHPEPAPPSAAELAASREARFESGPPAMRALFQFGKAARQALPGFGETAGLEAVPPPSGGVERAASVAGGLAGFSAVALPVTAATGGIGAAPLVAGAIGAGVAGAAAPGTLKERVASGGTMAASSAVLGKVLQSVSAALARNVVEKAPQIAAALRGEFRQLVDAGIRRGLPAEQATAEASAAIGAKMDAASRAAVNRVIRTREAASAVGGAATFGVVQPAAERYALRQMGEQPQEPTTGDMVQSGLELLAVNLLTGGHAILRGAPEAKPGPARATAVEAPERGITPTKPYEPVPGQIKAVQKRMEAEKAQAAGKPLTAPQEAAAPIQAQQPAPAPEVQPAPKIAPPAENLARIAALTRQIEKNPGDKRVTKWQRRIEDLGGVAPKPKVGRRPSGPGIPTEEPAPPTKPVLPQEERAAKLERMIAERPQDKNVKRWKARLVEIRATISPEQRINTPGGLTGELPGNTLSFKRARAEEQRNKLPTELVTESAPRPKSITAPPPAEKRAPAPAAEVSPPSRMLVPNMEFGEEAAARRLATSIARDRPEAAPTVIKTRKGFQVEVNAEAGESRLRKQTFAPAKPAPAAAPEPQLAARGEPVLPEGKGKGAVPEPVAAKRTFVEEFEDLARQGRSLRDATDQAMERSGAEPPAGLDLESRWNRVRHEKQRELGQTDIFGGAALLGEAGARKAPEPERPAGERPPPVAEAVARAEKSSEATTVPVEGLWFWKGFQHRDVSRETEKPTQNVGGLVNPSHVRMLAGERGFDLDEIRRRPILVWRDEAGELGAKGRRYVIDGHHRTYMAEQAGAKKLPAVEVFGSLEYAREQARLANLAGVPNTLSEQSKIARDLRERGDPLDRVAAQLRVRESKVKGMIDFAHMDQSVRETYFPSGNETGLLGSTVQGETVGRYARESPELMSPDVQRQWLDQAVNGGLTPAMFSKQLRQWHDALKALKQETIDLPGGGKGVKLAMTPKQFSETAGRLLRAIESQKRALADATSSLETVSEMAKGAGHDAAREFVDSRLAQVGTEGARLVKAKKEIAAAINATIAQGGDVAAEFDKIQKRVDEILGNKALPDLTGEQGFVRIPDLMDAVGRAIRRLSGIVRRDPYIRRVKEPSRFEPPAVVQKITDAIRSVTPKRAEQEQLRSEELGRRVRRALRLERGKTGLERHAARRRAIKGQHETVDFESIASKLTQDDMNQLVDIIYSHPGLNFFERDNAVDALEKLWGERGVQVPQERELELLETVFGSEFVKAVMDARPKILNFREKLFKIASVSKALRTSFDMSGPLRQGLYFLPSHPLAFARAFGDMHRFWASEDAYKEGMEAIAQRKNARVYRYMGLALTRTADTPRLSAREEAFFGAEMAEKLPFGIGKGVRASDRAYVGFLNRLRADVAENLIGLAKANGYDFRELIDPKVKLEPERRAELERVARLVGDFINAGTGRGSSEFITRNAEALNAAFFSPRMIKARLHMLNPKHYVAGPEFLRREYLKSTGLLAGSATIVLTLAAWAGAQVEKDKLSADFAKIRVGPIVYDILGGFQQDLRLFVGLTSRMWDQREGKPSRVSAADLLGGFAENKLSPAASFALDWLRGWKLTSGGRKYLTYEDLTPDLLNAFVPMLLEDIYQVAKADPRQLPYAVPASAYGVSVQNYPPPGQRHRGPQAPKAPHAPTAP